MAKLLKKFQNLFKEDDNEPEISKQQTVVLGFHMHCKGCAWDLKKFIFKWKGVTSVIINETNATATVEGMFDEQKLVNALWIGAKKRVKIIESPEKPTKGVKIGERDGKSPSMGGHS